MKKLIVTVLALLASIASAQSTPKTPNLNFWLPQYGQLNWQEPYNANTTQLDLMLSGQAPVPGLNVGGQFKAINSITSTTPVIDARFYGAVGDGTTDNTTAINNAIAAGISSNECVFFPPGVYAHASVITVTPGASVQSVCIEGKNRNSRFKYTGTSGATAGWAFVGGGSNNTKFVLRNLQWDANGNAQYALEISKSAKSEFFNLEARNATIGGFWCRNCVSDNWIQPVVSGHLEPFTTTPVNGLTLDTDGTGSSGGETITDMAFENVSGAGLNMASVVTSNIQGGTGELDGIGISCPAGCQSNHFEMQDLEANTSEDILLAGLNNTFTSELALDANSAQLNSLARGNSFLGGYYTQINVASGAYGNMFEGGRMVNAINDSGRYTTIRNMYDFPLAAFWPDVIPENATYSGAHTYNGQTTYGSLPIWSFPGWQGKFIALQQPENYLLQSGNAAISPWAYQQLGAGVAPTAAASGATDPLGNTGTVTEVQLSLGGGTTTGDRSILEQTVSGLSNPHSSRQCIYIKANTGTPTVLVGNLATGNGLQIVTTASWQGPICTTSVSSSSASDQWALEILGGSVYSSTADVLIYGAQDSLNNGKYVATTTAAIDFTPYVPLGGTSAGFTLGAQAITSTSNATAANTVIPNCATGGSGMQVCDAAGNWITPATGGVSSFNTRVGAIVSATGDYTAAQVTNAAATNTANTYSGAQTVTGFPAGCVQVPCQVANIASATYSGATSTGLATLYTTSSAGLYRICSTLVDTVAPTAASSQEIFIQYIGDGHTFSNSALLNSPSLGTSITQWVSGSGCGTFYADASTAIQWELLLSGVTGTPTYRYSVELERVIK